MAEKHQKKKKGSALKILLAVLLLLVLTVGAAGVFAYNEINGNGGKPGAEVTVSIPQGSGVAAIAKELKEAGVIRSAYLFRWYVGHKGAAGKLQYGDFTLQTGGYSYDGLITELSTYAKADSVRLTFPEGTTAIAIARKMEEAGLCTAEEFLEEANTGDFSEYTFWQSIPAGIRRTGSVIANYWEQLKLIVQPKTQMYEELGGFIAIGSIFPSAWNWQDFWSKCAFISIILAIMNILPIPGLDGGHAIFTLWEMITGRKPSDRFLEAAQYVGLAIILVLLVYANGNDIYRFFIK